MRIAVIFGGMSRERDVSMRSGAAVSAALRAAGHDVIDLEVGDRIAEDIIACRPDVAFLALHGRFGEDGTVQGLLELLRIPYTGSSCMASALAMDKTMTKKIWLHHGIRTPEFFVTSGPETARQLDYPLVVKPPREGSTIGISFVSDDAAYADAVEQAVAMDGEALVERCVTGPEFSVAVFGDDVFTPIEIRPSGEHYDYHCKYTKGATSYILPPECPDALRDEMMATTLRCYRAVGCSGAARVDFIADAEGRPWALEINTIPGMTETSLLPKAAAYHGITFVDLVGRMLAGAKVHIPR